MANTCVGCLRDPPGGAREPIARSRGVGTGRHQPEVLSERQTESQCAGGGEASWPGGAGNPPGRNERGRSRGQERPGRVRTGAEPRQEARGPPEGRPGQKQSPHPFLSCLARGSRARGKSRGTLGNHPFGAFPLHLGHSPSCRLGQAERGFFLTQLLPQSLS